MKFKQLGLVGCGLMGGSFALALRAAWPGAPIRAYSRSPASSQRAQSRRAYSTASEARETSKLATAVRE